LSYLASPVPAAHARKGSMRIPKNEAPARPLVREHPPAPPGRALDGQALQSASIPTGVALGVASPALLRGLEALIHPMPGFTLAGNAQTIDALLALCARADCGVVLLDAAMAHPQADRLITALRAGSPATRIVLIAGTSHTFTVREALRLGAYSLISDSCARDDVLAALHATVAGRRYIAPAFSVLLTESLSWEALTQREMQVLSGLARGACNKAIARNLAVAVGTVKTHVRAIMDKLESRSRTDVVLKAIRFGLIGLEQ